MSDMEQCRASEYAQSGDWHICNLPAGHPGIHRCEKCAWTWQAKGEE